jgi:methyl-accepting chemotaxis protein
MLAKGELDTKISIKSKNEIGRMAEAINNAIGLFKSICKDIDEVMREISNGNLTVNTTINYVGDFKSIQSSVTQLIEKIGELMSSVISTAEQVASGANLVSNSSNLLSQGATEQASSVEELTASLEEIAAQTSINAQNAQTANESAKQ